MRSRAAANKPASTSGAARKPASTSGAARKPASTSGAVSTSGAARKPASTSGAANKPSNKPAGANKPASKPAAANKPAARGPAKKTGDDALRAAKLSWVPGVTIRQVSKRFGMTPPQIRVARLDSRSALSLAELALAALTTNGTHHEGTLDDLRGIASFIDYVNHDAATVVDARRLLDECVAKGLLEIDGNAWRLLQEWP
jgi:hypothetical protein